MLHIRKSTRFAAALLSVLLLSGCTSRSTMEERMQQGGGESTTAAEPQGRGTPFSAAPASAPTPEPTPAPTPAPDPADVGKLTISEVMYSNKAAMRSPDGGFYDWIELENNSGQPLSTAGWTLSDTDGESRWAIPEQTLAAGELLLVLAPGAEAPGVAGTDFALSDGETLTVLTPSGAVSDLVTWDGVKADRSLIRENGDWVDTAYSTPGFPNDRQGYESFCRTLSCTSPLQINEVMAANLSVIPLDGSAEDWIELKNVSGAPVELSDYYLSDTNKDYLLYRLPEGQLGPGEFIVIYATDVIDRSSRSAAQTGFKLGTNSDQLFLSTSTAVADCLWIHDMPVDGSCGRMPGENGFFYFTTPSPRAENAGGERTVTAKPAALERDGVYTDVDSVSVALSGSGTIYYTTDGSVPTLNSAVYTAPLTLTDTTVVRAIACESGAIPSRVTTLTYIINDPHDLPVVSLVVDDPGTFERMYGTGYPDTRIPGSFSLYETDGTVVTNAGGIGLAGAGTRTKYPKKSLSIKFSGKYGDGDLNYDVFGNGIDIYDALTLHVGEDYLNTVVRTDFFQTLGIEMGHNVVAQSSKYTVVYVNGKYYGLYCLKERWTEQFYASWIGGNVDKDSCEVLKYPVDLTSSFYLEVLKFCRENDMSIDENYDHLCEVLDIDSFIDWILLEGLAGNPDMGGNMRVLRTTEGENTKWHLGIYDLDWAMQQTDSLFYNYLVDHDYHTGQIRMILFAAMKNPRFIDRILSRYAEVDDTVLNNEHMVELIDSLAAEIRSEMPREVERWSYDYDLWESRLVKMKDYISGNDMHKLGIEHLCRVLQVDEATKAKYFG